MIKPTVGRIVHIWRNFDLKKAEHDQPEFGIICHVSSDRLITVAAFNHYGERFPIANLQLLQEDDKEPEGDYAEWPQMI